MKPLWTEAQIDRYLKKFRDNADDISFEVLMQAGEYAVKIAREEGRYTNITGNLRSSIGYAVVNSGSITTKKTDRANVGTDGGKGVQEADKLITELARQYNNGLVLIVVAGMEYAVYVEAMENKDVLTNAAFKGSAYLKSLIKEILK